MKKVMFVAALAALTVPAYAAPCTITGPTECATVFELKASGKISGAKSEKVDYKVNKSLSAKGYLLIDQDYLVDLLAAFKFKDKKIALVAEDGELIEYAAYGKHTDLFNTGAFKPGKTYKLESDLGFRFEDADAGDATFTLLASTFGTVKAKVSKGTAAKNSGCTIVPAVKGCIPFYTPVKYTGYFAGYFDDCYEVIDGAVLNSDCEFAFDPEYNLVGGKVTLKYSKLSADRAIDKFERQYSKYEWINDANNP